MSSSYLCPYPLVYANASTPISDNHEIHWAYEDGNCAIRCPSVTLTEEEMSDFYSEMKWMSIASFIASTLLLLFHIRHIEKRFLVVMFLLGFWLESVGIMFFLPLNKNYKLICENEYLYVPEESLCVMQSFLLIYSLVWVMTWGAIYTVDVYVQVQFKLGTAEVQRYRRYYVVFVLLLSGIVAMIPLAAGNLGYDYSTSLQTCLYLFGDHQAYFWLTLVLPFSVMLFTSFFFSVLTFRRLHHIFVQSELRQNIKQRGRIVSDASTLQDEYSERIRFNYWSTDYLDNDFDTDGKIIVNPSISNPLSAGLELSKSESSEKLRSNDENSDYPSELSAADKMVQLELEESRLSVVSLSGDDLRHFTIDRGSGVTTSSDEEKEGIPTAENGASERSETPQSDKSKEKISKQNPILICLQKTWKYNGRMILFLLFYCLVAIYILPTLIYMYYTKYDYYVDGTKDYVQCLVYASLFSDVQTQQAVDAIALALCGSHPATRPPFILFKSVSYYAAGFGMIPVIIFGKSPALYVLAKIFKSIRSDTTTNIQT